MELPSQDLIDSGAITCSRCGRVIKSISEILNTRQNHEERVEESTGFIAWVPSSKEVTACTACKGETVRKFAKAR